MRRIIDGIDRDVWGFNPLSYVIAIGRSGLALAQLVVLIFTPAPYLFVPIFGQGDPLICNKSLDAVSIYCVGDKAISIGAAHVILIACFLIVASGLLPRYTSILHFWATFSLSNAVTLPDGGDTVVQFASLFLVFICLPDGRLWQWSKRPVRSQGSFAAALRGISWGAHWALRVQMAYIYIHSAMAKLSVENWSEGSAIYYIIRGDFFGTGNILQGLALAITGVPIFALALTWGTILSESFISLSCIAKNATFQFTGFTVSLLLHLGIIAFLGLWSFGTIMIFSVLLATSRGVSSTIFRLKSARSLESKILASS